MRGVGRRGEYAFVMLNTVYLAVAAFIAWGGFASFTG